ncbi:MAG: alanine racemase [Zetaproteobacteria bacterium CG_4_9_14_3_um_filter_49_83]|nr:MAG: alanine racemase [Zetaproteobacteria bacterium CG1_02_49_23]PIQ31282.1 MAG: alanine racemase [Zetaproteobacteria bacterium CG17_big_fil_post_rev_8_21_14_2_50_50_13]PIV30591.1 MAG: alanine racemase [Zetaproteobacteria bacterium CG02_land_8_20_14_3_00_50_9]PIY55600.1 MAG: alanine racemase [Zetaproteobacteria bacterium CG_4_10_14_0_8_um_filter_49_80]PJA35492.1 MAG: alanine racemase [Zetaproteobacteria bacterium CG_4_9_14_3_um_filter_49_83]
MRPAIALIHLDRLRDNFEIVTSHAGHANIISVVKSNAYGHGLHIIAPELHRIGCRNFAVTEASEGARLRDILGPDCDITLLSGLFDSHDAELCGTFRLSPVVTEQLHIQWLRDNRFNGSVWLKVDTGMQRLGTTELKSLHAASQASGIGIAGIMSHLACADTPEHPLNRSQADAFSHLCSELPSATAASLLNSAGLIALPDQTLDFVRPGLALYGAEPVIAEPLGLKPVMEFTAQVMQVRDIEAGTPVSYGATFTANKNMRIALICTGYADGLPVSLSNNGFAEHDGALLPIIGRVCMDYCLLDCTEHPLQTGQRVSFWGGDILKPEQVAARINTIPYTLMTGVSDRVHREVVTNPG